MCDLGIRMYRTTSLFSKFLKTLQNPRHELNPAFKKQRPLNPKPHSLVANTHTLDAIPRTTATFGFYSTADDINPKSCTTHNKEYTIIPII